MVNLLYMKIAIRSARHGEDCGLKCCLNRNILHATDEVANEGCLRTRCLRVVCAIEVDESEGEEPHRTAVIIAKDKLAAKRWKLWLKRQRLSRCCAGSCRAERLGILVCATCTVISPVLGACICVYIIMHEFTPLYLLHIHCRQCVFASSTVLCNDGRLAIAVMTCCLAVATCYEQRSRIRRGFTNGSK